MVDEMLGITESIEMPFAFPLGDGRWARRAGLFVTVDGHLHKVSFPDFETRSGESFGVTAAFHVVEGEAGADVAARTFENGKLIAKGIVASDVVFAD